MWLDGLTDADVRKKLVGPGDRSQLDGYLGAYQSWRTRPNDNEARARWFTTLDETTHWLWRAMMGPVLMEVPTLKRGNAAVSVPEVVLIPTGVLGLLPLHAAWTEDQTALQGRRYALDVATPRYAPNARALNAAQANAGSTGTDRLLLCVEPEPVRANRLPAAKREAKDILRYWPRGTYTVRWHRAATHSELVDKLPLHTCLHFAGHAFAGWSNPQQGGLLMASDKVLTVKELAAMRLSMRLAVLSACETGVPGIELPDEVIGLPSALMQGGVAGIVASLWLVADDSTAQLMIHFYRLWHGQSKNVSTPDGVVESRLSPAESLRQAQMQLRKEGYTHPYYWGAFAYTGL